MQYSQRKSIIANQGLRALLHHAQDGAVLRLSKTWCVLEGVDDSSDEADLARVLC